MKEYEVIVIGSGAGMLIVERAVAAGLTVALVEKGLIGGTCLNVGCIPSKMLIHPADRIVEIQEAGKLGIEAQITSIDFNGIMERMRTMIAHDRAQMQRGIEHTQNLDLYRGEGVFTADYTLAVNGTQIRGERIFIASGARPVIPQITGINEVQYLTNENLFDLKERPESMVIVGGGYIATEYGHFFAAMGTDVTIVQRGNGLLPHEEPEISALLQRELARRMTIVTGTEVSAVRQKGAHCVVIARDRATGDEREITAERVMIAVGRQSNADRLKVEHSGVETDDRGFIRVNDYLETSKERIWALGDAIGKYMFRHVANEAALVAWHNSTHTEHVEMNYRAIPHAVYSWPQIASAGMTEAQAKRDYEILVGTAHFSEVAKGQAMRDEESFAKAIVDRESKRILGFHIIGPHAPILIQEVIQIMADDRDYRALGRGIHIHPALSEVILATLRQLRAG
ncbi:MAG TPA: dihydrolipoyl dehydrogenase [Methanomicrobia archaeon]|nr:dihydrolipoyl dehydrogenase [Methanomicrobia archaeon]